MDDGSVFSWGHGREGALGHNDRSDCTTPRKVLGLLAGEKVISVKCGGDFTVALTEHGKVYTWGADDEGQLGQGGQVRYQLGS